MNYLKYKNSFLRVFFRELNRIGSKRTLYYMLILLPVFLFLFYPYIYTKKVVREIPIVICDYDKSEISRLVIQYFASSPDLSIYKYVNSVKEIEDEFKSGNIYGAILIPTNFEKDIKSNKSTSIIVYNNCTNLITANTILKNGTQIIKTLSAGVILKKLRSSGLIYNNALNLVNSITIETKVLFNPNYNYLDYLAVALIPAMLQMIIMITSALLINSEVYNKTLEELIDVSSGKVMSIIFGKATAHLLIYLSVIIFILFFIFPLFGISFTGSELLVLIWTFYFVLASFFIGFLVSVLVNDEQFALEIMIFINTPAFIFSGYVYPLSAMPEIHNIFAQLIPFTHYLAGFIKLYQMGLGLASITKEFLILSLFIMIPFLLTIISLKFKIKNFKV